MDNLTHGLTGAGIGLLLSQGLLSTPADPALVITAVVASQVPDVDALLGARGQTYYLKHHRGFSHSLFTAPVSSLGIAAMVGLFFDTAFWLMFLTAFLSLSLHIFLDVFNAYGTKALWPVSKKRFAWDVLMVVDPIIIAVFVVGIGAYAFGYSALLYGLYPGLVLYLLSMVKHRFKAKKIMERGFTHERENINLMPPMIGWRTWNFIVLKDEKYYLGKVNIASRNMNFQEILNKPESCPSVESSKADPKVQVFLDFARFPYYSKYQTADGEILVRWSDLRYKLREKEHFTLWSKTTV